MRPDEPLREEDFDAVAEPGFKAVLRDLAGRLATWLPEGWNKSDRWTDYDDDPQVVGTASVIREALLLLPRERRSAALFLTAVCASCGRQDVGVSCMCMCER